MTSKRITETYLVDIERDSETGNVLVERWFDAQGRLHRDDRDLPAFISYSATTGGELCSRWCYHGKSHREGDKPALIQNCATTGTVIGKSWKLNGVFHRAGGKPASITYDFKTGRILTEEYYQHGKLHRDNFRPAVIEYAPDSGKITSSKIYIDDTHIPKRRIKEMELKPDA